MSAGITPISPAGFTTQESDALHENFLERDLVAVDVAANTFTGGLPDETISSRLARDAEQHKVVGEVGSKILDVFQHDHGALAQAGDSARAKDVIAAEQKVDGQPVPAS